MVVVAPLEVVEALAPEAVGVAGAPWARGVRGVPAAAAGAVRLHASVPVAAAALGALEGLAVHGAAVACCMKLHPS